MAHTAKPTRENRTITVDFHDEAMTAGCNGYVTKPIDFASLESLIARLLSHQ